MNKIRSKYLRVLAIAPSTRGFGFAILEGQDMLVDWGVKSVTRNKNTNSVAKVEELVTHYQPDVMVLQDIEDSQRSARIKALSKKITDMAATRKVRVVLFSHGQVRQAFFPDGQGTKHALAEILAKRFPEELASRLPPKRRPWMSEDYRMDIFDAVALAVVFRLQ